MGEERFEVIVTASAREDLDELSNYWHAQGQPERGIQYAEDLYASALQLLSNGTAALQGKILRKSEFGPVREIRVFQGFIASSTACSRIRSG